MATENNASQEGPVEYMSRKQVPELVDALMLKMIDARPEDPRAFLSALLNGAPPPTEGSSRVALHLMRPSVTCHGPLLLLRLAGVDHDVVDVDLMKGEQLTDEYRAMNPTHTVPTLQDPSGGAVWDSNSILRYVAGKFLPARKYYPADHVMRAHCEMALDFRHTRLYAAIGDAAYPILGFKPDAGGAQAKAVEALQRERDGHFAVLADYFLNGKTFVCGEEITIADLAIFPGLTLLECVPDVTLPPVLQEYKKACWAATGYEVWWKGGC